MGSPNTPSHLLTVLTPDRRGIVAGISAAIEQAGGHLLELSQTVVRDYFTIIVALELPASEEAAPGTLSATLQSRLGAHAAVTLLPYHGNRSQSTAGERFILTAQGQDTAGIVPLISGMIADRGGNFADFSCRLADDGGVLMLAEVDLPAEVALDQLQIDLQHAAAELGLRLRLQHHRLFLATNEIPFRRVVQS